MTIEIITSNGDKFSVEYEVETPPNMKLLVVNIKNVWISKYLLEFYDLKIVNEETYNELIEACKNNYANTKDDLVNIQFR